MLQPFSYGAPVQDTSFPVGWDLTHRAWASGPSDVYVPVSKVDASASGGYVSAIAHKDANGWSLELAGVYVWCKEVSGADANNVYAGCVKYEDYFYKGVIVRRIGKNNWQEVKMFGLTKPDVTSLWCASASDCFAVVQHCQDATHCWPTLWRGSGTTWNTMSVPLVSNGTGRRVRCISPGDCYVIGEEGPKAFLWQLVGSSWKNVTTLPSDVTYLWDLSGTDEELVVVGQTEDAGVKNGVRLTSDDFVSWDRDDSPETAVDGSVWVPWNGSALVAGTIEDESGLQYPGDARLCGKSLGLFAEETSVDGTLLGVTSIIPISDNTVLLTAYGSIDAHVASVYVVTYQ